MKRQNRRFIHVFGGIDALSVAKPDWEPVAFSEVEPFACAVLAHHHPEVPNLGDITKINFTQFAGNADIYGGGSPCQTFSVAGLRKSLKDTRGNLTLEYIRGFNESECPIGLWENVPGVLTTDDNAFGLFVAGMVGETSMLFPDDKQAERWLIAEWWNTIIGCYLTLANFRLSRTYRRRHPKIKWGNAGMVFGQKGSFAWRVLDAQYFSLPQRRERVFGVAFRPRNAHRLLGAEPGADLTRFLGLPGAILFEPGSLPRNPSTRSKARQKATRPTQGSPRGDSPNHLRRLETSGGVDACGCDGGIRRRDDEEREESDYSGSTERPTSVFGGGNLSGSLDVAPTCTSHSYRWDIESEAFVCFESSGYKQIDISPTLDTRCKDGPVRNQQAPFVCFQQNSRHEVRLTNGDGQIAGALTSEPGMHQQNYLAFSYKDHGEDAGLLSPTLRSGGFKNSHANSGAPPAVVIRIDNTSCNGWGVLDDGTAHTLGGSTDAVAYALKDTSNLGEERRGLALGDVAFTLDTRGRAGCLTPWDYQRVRVHSDRGIAPCLFNNGDGGGNEVPSLFTSNILRRFSPTECLRLQGFPDDYLNITYRGKPAFNGPKYRAIGNSWAVTVARWVGDRIDLVLDIVSTELSLNSLSIHAEPQLNIQSTFRPSPDQIQHEFSLSSVAPHPELAAVEESLNVEQKPKFVYTSATPQPEFRLSSVEVHHNLNNDQHGVQSTTVSQGERSSCAITGTTAENSGASRGERASDDIGTRRGSLRRFEQGEATSSSQSLPRAVKNRRGNRKGQQRHLEKEEIIQCNSIEPTLKVHSTFTDSSDRVQTEFSLSSVEVQSKFKPFLKWAGGKTWAIPLIESLYDRNRRYRDLTLGSGAIPLALQPNRVYVSDINPQLIGLWEWVKADGKLTIDLNPDKEHYLQCRDRFNNGDPEQAQLFYYLNHTCWRGLCRSSKPKLSNVPWGEYKKFYGQKDLSHYKQTIEHWEFAAESWEAGLKNIQLDDFIVFDPPYHSADGKGFTGYCGTFTEIDQIAAAKAFATLDVPVVAFNAATDFILDLYRGLGFDIQLKEAPRMISSSGDRAPALEMVATRNTDQKLVHISDFREQRATDDQLTTDSCQSDLTYDEQRDRLQLEREVEQGFHKAGKALMNLRDRRLYSSTHPSWEAYCQDRFGFSHQNGDKKIAAARVVDVLTSNHCQLLPSCVEQAYPLSKLKEEKQIVESWEELTQEGKRPSGRRVSAVVAEICDRQLARGEYHNPWKVGDICQIHKKGDSTLAKYDGLWSVVSEVKPRQCVVKVWNKEVLVKAENLEELQVGEDFLSVCDRIRSLMSRHINGDIELKRGQLRFLEALGEQSSMFESEDLQILKCIEAIANNRDASLVQATTLIVDNIEYLIPEEVQDLSVALRSTHGF